MATCKVDWTEVESPLARDPLGDTFLVSGPYVVRHVGPQYRLFRYKEFELTAPTMEMIDTFVSNKRKWMPDHRRA